MSISILTPLLKCFVDVWLSSSLGVSCMELAEVTRSHGGHAQGPCPPPGGSRRVWRDQFAFWKVPLAAVWMAHRAAAEWARPFPAAAHLVRQVRRGRKTPDQLWARCWVLLEQWSG